MIANNISKRWFLLSLLMALLISWGAMVWESADAASLAPSAVFSAELSGMQEVPMNDSMGHGHAVFVLDSDMMTLNYRLMVHDLMGVTAGHIHVGAMGANGGVVVPLDVTGLATSMYASGTVTLTVAQVAEMEAGNYYVNIHTSMYAGGEIRGQIMPQAAEKLGAVLMGSEEVPAVETMASGVVLFTPVSTNTWSYEIAANDIVSVTAGHIHAGMMGQNGGPVKTLNVTNLAPMSPTTGTVMFDTSAELLDFLTGQYYVNIHTSANPNGEIRGQIMPTMAMPYMAKLGGDQEVTPVMTSAMGKANLVVDSDWTTAYYRVQVSDIMSITMAHIHNAPMGQNGSAPFGLYSGGSTFDPTTPLNGMIMLNIVQLADLVAGHYYVNVHTEMNPSGEIRGQLMMDNMSMLMLNLTGAEEVPPVSSMGSAMLDLEFHTPTMLMYDLSVMGVMSPTAAHIHQGAMGSMGSPVFTLYDGSMPLDDMNSVKGMLMLTAQQLLELCSGNYYVNLHTAAHPGGELRGQIMPEMPVVSPMVSTVFSAELSGMQEVPMNDSMGHGHAVFVLDSDMMTLNYRLMVHDLMGVTAGHIHVGAMGANGGVVVPLDVTGLATSMYASGTVTLTVAQVAEMEAGNYYVNIHTSMYAGGEIRGQIMPQAAEKLGAVLMGSEEVPAVETMASGVVLFTPVSTNTWSYEIAANDIVSVTAGHIHAGMMGQNGGPVKTLNVTNLAPMSPTTGTVMFDTSAELLDFLTGQYYVNIHTSANPNGEIRGQIMPTMAMPYMAKLGGDQEVTPVMTSAMGKANLVVDSDWTTAYYRVQVSDIMSITMAHIHNAPMGQNGSAPFGLYSGGSTFDPTTPLNGMIMLNIVQLADLVAGHYYVNVHTEMNPSGEIRGQLMMDNMSMLMLNLTGAEEVPPVSSMGSAMLDLEFHTPTMLMYDLSVMGVMSPTAAHIHQGAMGSMGSPVFTLYDGSMPLDDMNSVKGMLMLTAQQLLELNSGNYYVNLHTAAHPSGELRAQIKPADAPTAVGLTQSAVTSSSLFWLLLVGGTVIGMSGYAIRRQFNR